ncbi:MAG: DNA replication and repair protein RecF [Alphaproteobacteria bacterium]|nr:DNA replication and repair protein RecF [Alphaproteobacteria bacterium]
MITTLTLTNFRNHKSLRVSVGGAKHIVLYGANGAGKTNVIEAISLLGSGSGLRRSELSELSGFGSVEGFGVHAELDSGDVVATACNAERRAVKVNGQDSSFAELLRIVKPLWITPREDGLFYGAASDRRAFFDHLISGFSPAHAGRLSRMVKLISERAAAIKSGGDEGWLSAIEENLMQTASAVAAERVKYCGELNYFFKDNTITVAGWIEDRIIAGEPISEIENEYLKYLSENRALIGDRQIFDGPQKSDFKVASSSLGRAANLCSTGQQKSILLALALAHARLVAAVVGVKPIILLDEVVAHLDDGARARLFDELGRIDAQVWMTGVDSAKFEGLEEKVMAEVK